MEWLHALTVMAVFVIGENKFCVLEKWHMSDGIEYNWYSCLYPDWPACWAQAVDKMNTNPTGTEGLSDDEPGPHTRSWGCELNPDIFEQRPRGT